MLIIVKIAAKNALTDQSSERPMGDKGKGQEHGAEGHGDKARQARNARKGRAEAAGRRQQAGSFKN